jgi:hypothetical protein
LLRREVPYSIHPFLYTTYWELLGVYSTIWCLCYKTNELKEKREKEGNRPTYIGWKRGN